MNKVKPVVKSAATNKTNKKAAKKSAKLTARTAKYGPKAQTSFKRNIVPILAGLLVMFTLMGVLNGQWLVAQYKFHVIKPVSTASAPASVSHDTTKVAAIDTRSPHPEQGPQVTIPAIDVNAPLQFDQGTAEWQIQLGLRKGVVHYDGSALPGQTGNVVLFGHSSGQPWAPGDYKFVFTLLSKVKTDDAIYLDYNGTRYTYRVERSEVVAPTDVGVLKSGNDHELTLITCTPVGTSTNRLVVHAEQVTPNPNAKPATAASQPKPAAKSPAELPGTAKGSLWQSIRNLF